MDEIERWARDLAPDIVKLAAGSRVTIAPDRGSPLTHSDFCRLVGYLRNGTGEVPAVPSEIELTWEPNHFVSAPAPN